MNNDGVVLDGQTDWNSSRLMFRLFMLVGVTRFQAMRQADSRYSGVAESRLPPRHRYHLGDQFVAG